MGLGWKAGRGSGAPGQLRGAGRCMQVWLLLCFTPQCLRSHSSHLWPISSGHRHRIKGRPAPTTADGPKSPHASLALLSCAAAFPSFSGYNVTNTQAAAFAWNNAQVSVITRWRDSREKSRGYPPWLGWLEPCTHWRKPSHPETILNPPTFLTSEPRLGFPCFSLFSVKSHKFLQPHPFSTYKAQYQPYTCYWCWGWGWVWLSVMPILVL